MKYQINNVTQINLSECIKEAQRDIRKKERAKFGIKKGIKFGDTTLFCEDQNRITLQLTYYPKGIKTDEQAQFFNVAI